MARTRTSLFYPILIAALAIAFSITILVGWSVIFTQYYLLATETKALPDLGVGYWLILSGGCVFLVLVIGALALFLKSHISQALYMRRQDTFLDSVTHELKSPLASLRLGLETMQMRQLSPQMQERFVTMMRRDVDRLQDFVEHVLEASRLEHAQNLELEPTVLPELLDQVLKQIHRRHTLSNKAITVVMDLETPERPLRTDPVALELILINLIDNAVKYSPRDHIHVRVHMHEEPSHVIIEVSDQGMGIPPTDLKRIFERFFRVERTDAPQIQGTGLGLYVVASLIKRLGGSIKAHSQGANTGTTFTLKLPSKRGPGRKRKSTPP